MSFTKPKHEWKDDDYMTPKYAWEDIVEFIPKDKEIWESFYGDGQSKKFLNELGFKNVIHEKIDFFKENRGEIIVSNPPFSKSKEVLTRCVELGKPFILIMPVSKMSTQYFKKIFKDEEKVQIILPKKRIAFIKNGVQTKSASFECYYYCWKMNLEKDITQLY